MERPAGRLALAVLMSSERLVLALDGGPASAAALRWVIDRVGHRGAEHEDVQVVDVIDPSATDVVERRRRIRAMTDLLGLVAPSAHAATGPADDPVDLLSRCGDALVVVGAHRRDRTHASFLQLAASHAPGPVVVVPSDWICREGPVMVGVGDEDDRSATIAFAEREAGRRGTEVRLIHAWDTTGPGELPPEWDFGTESIPERQGRALAGLAQRRQAAHPGLAVTPEAVQGQVVSRLTAAAGTASLLVVGRSHRNAVVRALFGSTADGVIETLPCPVAVIP